MLSGDDVEGADVPRSSQVTFPDGRTEDDEIFPDHTRRGRLRPRDRSRIARMEPHLEIDEPLVAEAEDRLSGSGVDRLQEIVDGDEETAVAAIRALPVVETAPGESGQIRMDPDLLSGRRVQRDERVVLRQHIHHVVDDDRIEGVGIVVVRRVEPGGFEPSDILLRDLIQSDELRLIRAATVVLPGDVLAIGGLGRLTAAAPGEAHANNKDDRKGPPVRVKKSVSAPAKRSDHRANNRLSVPVTQGISSAIPVAS